MFFLNQYTFSIVVKQKYNLMKNKSFIQIFCYSLKIQKKYNLLIQKKYNLLNLLYDRKAIIMYIQNNIALHNVKKSLK